LAASAVFSPGVIPGIDNAHGLAGKVPAGPFNKVHLIIHIKLLSNKSQPETDSTRQKLTKGND